MTHRRILFLDIDGVLNNEPYCRRVGKANVLDPDNVAALHLILAAVPEAEIVISSSWRILHKTLELIQERLQLEGLDASRIVGLTPSGYGETVADPSAAPSIEVACPRGHEIRAWLESTGDVAGYAILDDSSDAGEGHAASVFVQTSFSTGLTAEHAARAITILRGATSPPMG